jgi:hypothetical protein
MQESISMHPKASPWWWGVVYCDPDDRRILVPLRSKLGMALNLGHPRAATILSWTCAIAFLALWVAPVLAHSAWFARHPANLLWIVSANLAALGMIRLNGWFGWSDYRRLSLAVFGVIATGLGFAMQSLINGSLVWAWGAKLAWTHYLILAPVAAAAQTFGRWAGLLLLLMVRPASDRSGYIRAGLVVGLGFTAWEMSLVYFSGSWSQVEFGLLSIWERLSASMFHIYAGGLVALTVYSKRKWPFLYVIVVHSWMDFFTGGVAERLRLSLYGLETMFSACAVVTWLVFLWAARCIQPAAPTKSQDREPIATEDAG